MPGVRQRGTRGDDALWAPLLGAIVAGAHLVMTRYMKAPIVQPDELGYIDNARHLALGGIRPITEYYPGLSILLTPLWWFSHNALTVWRGGLWINSVLCGLTTVVVWFLVEALSDSAVPIGRRVLVTIAVSAYPALVLYSNMSLAESFFQLGAAAVTLLACWTFRSTSPARTRRTPLPWVALGLAVGALTAVHPRGLAVVIAMILVAGILLRPWSVGSGSQARLHRSRPAAWMRMTALCAGALVSLAVTRIMLVAVRPSAGTSIGGYRADAVVGKAVASGSVRLLGLGLSGQVLYLTVATAALAPLGAVIGLGDLWRLVRGSHGYAVPPASAARAFAALSSLGVLGMSVLFLNGGDRADQIIYGRYNEGCVAALIVIALTWLGSGEGVGRRCLVWLEVAAVGLAVGVSVLEIGLTSGELHEQLNVETVLGLEWILRRSPDLDVAAIAVAGVISIAIVIAVFARFPTAAIVLVAVAFTAASIDTFAGFVERGSIARARQDVIATTLELASTRLGIKPSCVGWDASLNFTYFEDRFLLPGWKFEDFNGSIGAPPCGPFAISDHPDFFSHYNGSQIVTIENDLPIILYVVRSHALTVLQNAGWLLPAVIPGPLQLSRQRAELTAQTPQTMSVGSRAEAVVDLTNTATHGNPWPNERGLREGPYAVRLTARWFKAGQTPDGPGQPGDTPVATSVVELPETQLPGQRVTVDVPLDPRGPNGAALPAGQYTVAIAVYEELVGTIPGGVITAPITLTG